MSDRRVTIEKRINHRLDEFSGVQWCCVHDTKQAIQEWMAECDASNSTWFHRISDLILFRKWLIQSESLTKDKPTHDDFMRFIEYSREKGKKESSIKTMFHRISAYFRHLESIEVYQDITKGLKIKNIEYTERQCLTAYEAKRLIEAQTDIKKKTMICLMIFCGLRCIELAELKWSDIDGDRAVIRGKCRREKCTQIVIPISVQNCLSDLRELRPTLEPPDDYVFISDFYKKKLPMTSVAISKSVSLVLKTFFPERKGLSAHCLRHTAITLAIESGMDVTRVSRFARHRSLNTTMIYIHDKERFTDPAEARIESLINNTHVPQNRSENAEQTLKRALLSILNSID